MAYLKDALFQMVNDEAYAHHKKDLLTVHAKVIKAMKHLVKDFNLTLDTIRAFNTRKTLSNFSYLNNTKKTNFFDYRESNASRKVIIAKCLATSHSTTKL